MNSGKLATKSGVRADFWFGLGLVALGIAAAFESWRMPRLADLNVHPMTVPGLVPGMIGVVIAVLGAVLFLRAARVGGHRSSRRARSDNGAPTDPVNQTRRFFITLALCLGYAGGLIGSVPFWAATGFFVFLFVMIFEWQASRSMTGHLRAAATAMLLAIVVAAAVTVVFQQVFLVRLP